MAESGWEKLDRFLTTDPRDVGCDGMTGMLHVYVELVAGGDDPGRRYPGVRAHLAACGQCREDFDGLLAAVKADVNPNEH